MTPLDTLTSDVISWCRALGSNAKTVSDVINDLTLRNAIQKGIDDVNRSAASNAQKIQKWTMLPTDFSIAGGELGNIHVLLTIVIIFVKVHFYTKKFLSATTGLYQTFAMVYHDINTTNRKGVDTFLSLVKADH